MTWKPRQIYKNAQHQAIVDEVNKHTNVNWVNRLLQGKNRDYIIDWNAPAQSFPTFEDVMNGAPALPISTHKLSYATNDDETSYVYPLVQEIDESLIDMSQPWMQFLYPNPLDNAINNGDYIIMPTEDAEWFTKNYKDYYEGFPKYKKGSKIHIKKANRGKFTDYCGGTVTNECIQRGKNSSDPKIRKRATFAANARKWKKG